MKDQTYELENKENGKRNMKMVNMISGRQK